MRPRLRIFRGDDSVSTLPEPEISVPLSCLMGVLQDAVQWDRTWLQDFADDQVKVSTDLYDILTAYNDLRPSA